MKTPLHALRLVLLALLIQLSSPVFFSVITTTGTPLSDHQGKATLHANHTSIIAPQLIKEKDESESESFNFYASLVALIDFTDHSFVLTEWHSYKITPLVFRNRFNHCPPFYTLFRAFLV